MSDDTRIHFSEGKIPMKKKFVLMVAMLSGISVVAMEHIKEIPVLQEASHNEEESRVKIRLNDSQYLETTHEVAISVRLAKLIGALNKDLVEEPALQDSVFPLPNVTIVQWQIIEPLLEHVYRVSQDASQAFQLREAIITEFRKLDVKSLIGVICASDYLEIPILVESACEVLKQVAPDKISWEELEVLPRDIGNQIIMHKLLMLLGPVPVGKLAVGRDPESSLTSLCIMSGSDDRMVGLWDMEGNQLAVCRGHEARVESVRVTQEGKIVSGSEDSTVRVWDMEGNQLAICRWDKLFPIASVCVTHDCNIVSGSWDKTVNVWDMHGNQLAIWRGHEGWVISVCVTEDGKIVSGSERTVRVWDMEGKQLAECRGHEGWVRSVCVTKDGKIVSGSEDNTVRVWDMEGNQLAVCKGHEGYICSVCVTEDGKIVSGSEDNTVRVWDIEGNQLALCKGHGRAVRSVCVTKDGKIVSGSEDNTVRVWDMEGNQLALCMGHEGMVNSVCAVKEGKIISGSQDKTVRVWDISLLDRMRWIDEGQAQSLWKFLQNISQQAEIDKQKCWREIEKILGEDVPVAPTNINNNNNE